MRSLKPVQSITFLLSVIGAALLYCLVSTHPFPWRGHFDFIQYYCGIRLLDEGGVPYDAAAMLREQQQFRPDLTSPIMTWNPPWMLLAIRLVFTSDYEISLVLFLILTVASLLLAMLMYKSFNGIAWYEYLLAATFVPTVISFVYGQVSPILFLGYMLAAYGVTNQWKVLTGIGLFIVSWKPHLAVLFLAVLIFQEYLESRSFRLFKISLVTALTTLCLTELAYPGLLLLWLASVLDPQSPAVAPLEWIVTTLPGSLRMLLSDGTLSPTLPTLVVLPVGLLIVSAVSVVKRHLVTLPNDTPGLLCFSFLFSPYGWFYDAVILLPAYLLAVRGGFRSDSLVSKLSAGLLLLLQPLTLLAMRRPAPEGLWHLGLLGWFPLVIYACYCVLGKDRASSSKADSGAEDLH